MMSGDATILFIRLFAKQFYRVHASLFFLIIAFAAGFMRAQDHFALAEFFTAAPIFSFIPVGIWIAYGLFVVNYNHSMMMRKENDFARVLFLYPVSLQYVVSASVISIQLLPVTVYFAFLIIIAASGNLALPMFVLVAAFLGIFSVCTIFTRWLIIRPGEWSAFSFSRRRRNSPFVKPYPAIVLTAALRGQALAIIGYKVVSVLTLWGVLYIYNTGDYDLRLINLAVLVSFMAGTTFILEWHLFENNSFPIFRRMPFSLIQRIGYAFVIIILFALPEIAILMRNVPQEVNTIDLCISILFGINICFFWYAFLYVRDWKRETIVIFVSLAGIALFITILGGIAPSLLTLIHFIGGGLLFSKFYTRFEYREPPAG